MKLTDKELEIMAVLWKSSNSMTANEIIETSNNRKWKDSAIYVIMNKLIEKGAVVFDNNRPTFSKNARTYKPALTSAQYVVKNLGSVRKTGIHIDTSELIKCLMSDEEG